MEIHHPHPWVSMNIIMPSLASDAPMQQRLKQALDKRALNEFEMPRRSAIAANTISFISWSHLSETYLHSMCE